MSDGTVVPHSEELRRALRWIGETRAREGDSAGGLAELVSRAGAKFNLSPAEQDSLMRILSDSGEAGAGKE